MPVIGITPCRMLPDYVESVRRAGGEPRVLEMQPTPSLEQLDGVLLTGGGDIDPARYDQPRHPKTHEPDAARDAFEIEIARQALARNLPLLGVCRGLQVLTVAAGGAVRRNPKGREVGFGRSINLTEAGRKHPMYNGKHGIFNAPTVHLDEVETVAPGTTVLATNAVSDVQSAEIRCNGAVAWGVQYHPEYPLREVATIVRRIGKRLISEGFFLDEADINTFAGDLDVLDADPACKRLAWRYGIHKNVLDKKLRTGEVANWIENQVLPTRAKRGRG